MRQSLPTVGPQNSSQTCPCLYPKSPWKPCLHQNSRGLSQPHPCEEAKVQNKPCLQQDPQTQSRLCLCLKSTVLSQPYLLYIRTPNFRPNPVYGRIPSLRAEPVAIKTPKSQGRPVWFLTLSCHTPQATSGSQTPKRVLPHKDSKPQNRPSHTRTPK